VPGLDDDFAQMASEFDTLGELRADTRTQLERDKAMRQVMQARDLALDALLDQTDIPLPESVVADEVQHNRQSIEGQLSRAGASLDGYLEMTNQTEEQFETDLEQRAQRAVKISLVLDQLARNEELGVDPAELTAYVTRQAEQMGVSPDQLAQQLADNNQINVAAAEILRGKAMNLIAERVKVTDESGNPVDIATALNTPLTPAGDAADVDAADQEEVLAATETDETDETDEAGDADAKA
jgi:trigger factor